MPAPKRPNPNHPMAASAKAIEDDIAAALKADAPADPPALPADPPATTIVAPPAQNPPAPPAPAPAAVDDRMQQMLDTMMGRVEAQNEQIRALTDSVTTLSTNREFLERRNNELAAQNAELLARIDASNVTSGFQSDLVDPQHFGEIYRGLQPTFKSLSDQVAQIVARLNETEKQVQEAKAAPAAAIGRFRKEILDKTVRKGTPEFSALLRGDKAFQDFLQETIPGSRRTRMQEVQEAWEQEDEAYFATVVSDFKKRGNPTPVPPADPPRAITEQAPKAPTQEPTITVDHLQTAFQQVLEGTMKREDYRKLDAAAKRQGVHLPAR